MIEYYINLIYYLLFKTYNRSHYLFHKVNPARLLELIPNIDYFVKKHYPGWEREKEYHKMITNPKFSLNIVISSVMVMIILTFALCSIINFLKILHVVNIPYTNLVFFLIFIIVFMTFYYSSEKDFKHLKYFKKFDGLDKKAKRKLYLTGLGLIIVIVGLFWLSCYILMARHRQELLG